MGTATDASWTEDARLAALRRYQILDTPPETEFDDVARVAAQVCRVPIGMIAFVDQERVWSKARYGTDLAQCARQHSLCAHAILTESVLLVPDALADPRFADNPFVVGPPYLRAYAGAPIITPDGFPLGTVCVMDQGPRALTAEDVATLAYLAQQVMRQLEQRRQLLEHDRAPREPAAVADAVAESTRRFHARLEHSGDAVALLDAGGRIAYVSANTPQVLGYAPDELLGRHVDELIHPDDRAFTRERALDARAHPAAVVDVFARVCHRDGNWRLMEGILTNRLHDPAVRATVLTFRDMTERRRLEDELRQSQKMEAVGRLAGGVAHEFNNMLTAIIGHAELMRRTGPDADGLDHILAAAKRAASLTKQLLAFARRQALKPAELGVNALVESVERLLTRVIGEDILLATRLTADPGVVHVDAAQLEQVLMNLAINARDAMTDGGTLTVGTDDVRVDAELRGFPDHVPVGSYVRIAVADNGPGMTAEVRARAFDPFFTTKAVGIGSGLGLPTVYGFARQSGGYVALDSEPGRGTTVSLYLPRAGGPIVAAAEAARAGGRVLVVEDDGALRRLLVMILAEAGYQVIEEANGVDAIERLQAGERFDAIICDRVMPGAGGLAVARTARQIAPDARLLLISGYPGFDAGDLERELPSLSKPFSPRELLDRVAALTTSGASGA
ncbi:MAG TPA: ATP-binding protein [Kofleriaceae bacterium]|nr:ATP-binding protein [Kofleriaceae bacterium]